MSVPSGPYSRLIIERPFQGFAARMRAFRIYVDGEAIGKLMPGESIARGVTAGTHRIEARIDWTGGPIHSVRMGANDVVVSVLVRGNMLSRRRYLRFREGSVRVTHLDNWKLFLVHTWYSILPMMLVVLAVAVVVAALGG